MIKRKMKGSALLLVIASTAILAILGMTVLALLRLFGGSCEIRNASDSGTLGVARQAIGVAHPSSDIPAVRLNVQSPVESAFLGVAEPSTSEVDLQNYNSLVGQALLVALNAKADGNNAAIQNAKSSIQAIQGPNGIAARLNKKLQTPWQSDVNWVKKSYEKNAKANSLRMVKNEGQISWEPESETYRTGYVSLDRTNLELPRTLKQKAIFPGMLPLKNYLLPTSQVDLPNNATDGSKRFLNGYSNLTVDGIGTLFAVSMSSEDQPHMISLAEFNRQVVSPGAAVGANVPPNSFRTQTAVKDDQTQLSLSSQAASIIGTKQLPSPTHSLSIPRGYIIVDNGSGNNSLFHGILPQENVTADHWFGTTGVSVDAPGSGNFSNNGAVEKWMVYNLLSANPRNTMPQPSLNGLFTATGEPATLADARRTTPKLFPLACHCNDLNSDPQGPGANPNCVNYMTPQADGLGAFDHAYHPEFNPHNTGSSRGQLTSGELAKIHLWVLYMLAAADTAHSGIWNTPVTMILPGIKTGMRLYPVDNNPIEGASTPWAPPIGTFGAFFQHSDPKAQTYSSTTTIGQVTKDGSVLDLMGQVSTIGKIELRNFLINRMLQIKPDADLSEVGQILYILKKPLKINTRYYIYMDERIASKPLVMTEFPPPWLERRRNSQGQVLGETPDGKEHTFIKPFQLVGTLINPLYDFNVHEYAFMNSVNNKSQIDFLKGSFQPASGAYNLLGMVKFEERALTLGLPTVFSDRN